MRSNFIKVVIVVLAALPLAFTACTPSGSYGGGGTNNVTEASQSPASVLGLVAMKIIDNSGNLVYSDANSSSSLKLIAGETYSLNVSAPSAPSGTVFQLQATQINVLNGTQTLVTLHPGDNALMVSSSGDYSWKLIASAPNTLPLTKNYQADVSCASPTFTANSLNPAGIAVSGSTNMYNFNVAAVVANANGMATASSPYMCALDPTGVGIVDTAFQPCSQPFNNIYVNYVANRNIGVIVKDACNTSYAVSRPLNLAFAVPAMGTENVFIYGVTSNLAPASAHPVPSASNVTYLATNQGVNNIVQPNYSNGSFSIYSWMNYGQASSVNFGMQIKLTGIKDNINYATQSGSVDVSAALIESVEYKTDQNGDSVPSVDYKGSNCVLSQQNGKVLNVSGSPCSTGGSGTKFTVEIWGHYVCHGLSSASGSLDVTGDFDGLTTISSSCSGGGGGGGGITPITL